MLANKRILVTGATSGIGRAVVTELLGAGAYVVAIGRNEEKLKEIEREAEGACATVPFDLSNFSSYNDILSDIPPIDGMVYSAGIVENNPLRFFSLEKYQRTIDINQTAPLLLVSELVRMNKLTSASSIVMLSSITGTQIGMKGTAAYAATKAALVAIAKVMALELAHKGIRVNCVAPGMVHTPLVEGSYQLSAEAIQQDMARYPLGKRYAKPEEISSVVKFLLSDASSFITGQNLITDGGYTIQ